MLKFFRDQKNSWLMKGILILTALSFVSLFGSGRFLKKIPDEGKAVAKVAGKKITVAQFVNEVNHNVRSLSKMMQKPFTVQDAVQSGMLISLFNQMVSRSVMQAAADDLNLTVSDETVRKTIGQMPMFTDYDGSFSMAAYKQYLSDMGLSEKRFVDDAFLDMRAQQLTDAAQAATITPKSIAEMVYRLQNEKRTADVFTVTPADLKIKGVPGKADQERLYKELSDELIAPEYRTFTVMFLTLEDVSKKIKISEEELEEKGPMIDRYYHDVEKEAMRRCILDEGKRLDGRATTEIRPIWCETSPLPGPHGSSIFTRGETQSLSTVTLGTKMDEKIVDDVLDQHKERFLLHYNFPPYQP